MNQVFPKVGYVPSMRGQGASYAGRKGMPREWVLTMYADYQAGLSLAEVGAKHGRTRQSIHDIFKRRGLNLRTRNFQPVIEYRGRKYTEQKTGGRHRYLRDTISRTKMMYLHHVVWCEHHGPIPPGHKVAFKDGNHRNVAIDNLEMLTNSEEVKKYASKGQNQFTVVAKQKLAIMLGNHQVGGRSTLATLAGGAR
jgi:hypothetical protein